MNNSDGQREGSGQITSHTYSSGTLHMTTIADYFDPNRDIAMTPVCFIGREKLYPKWNVLSFVEPFPDHVSLEIAAENIEGLANHLLPRLAEELNAYHCRSYSPDFWRILIFPWLLELIQRTWTSFVRLRKIIEKYEGRTIAVPIINNVSQLRINDTLDFLNNLSRNYRFNWWIDSEVIATQTPVNWNLVPSEPAPHPEIKAPKELPITQSSNAIRQLLRNVKYVLGYTDILGLRWSGLFLAAYVNLLPKRPSKLKFVSDPHFSPERYFNQPFLRLLDKLIQKTMPDSFLTGFPELETKARRLPYIPGRLRLGSLSMWNEQEKVIAAFASEAGEKRVVFQHGGEYGIVKYNIMANEMELKSTIFISWGWSYDKLNSSHVLPLPSPFHSKLANSYKRLNDSIIVMGGPIRIHLSRVHWWYRSNTAIRYHKDAISFLKNVSKEVRKNILFRPYVRTATDIDTSQVIREHFPEIPMLEQGFDEALMSCRLVVFYSFGTAMNQTMAANVPTVVYMPPKIMTPHKEAEPYFAGLRRFGIIHDSAGSAAAHINRIEKDIEGWWHSPEVQEARKVWVNQFARTSRLWWWEWIKALTKLKNIG